MKARRCTWYAQNVQWWKNDSVTSETRGVAKLRNYWWFPRVIRMISRKFKRFTSEVRENEDFGYSGASNRVTVKNVRTVFLESWFWEGLWRECCRGVSPGPKSKVAMLLVFSNTGTLYVVVSMASSLDLLGFFIPNLWLVRIAKLDDRLMHSSNLVIWRSKSNFFAICNTTHQFSNSEEVFSWTYRNIHYINIVHYIGTYIIYVFGK